MECEERADSRETNSQPSDTQELEHYNSVPGNTGLTPRRWRQCYQASGIGKLIGIIL